MEVERHKHCGFVWRLARSCRFQGAIAKIFRKTDRLQSLPRDSPTKYTVTLYDLPLGSQGPFGGLCATDY